MHLFHKLPGKMIFAAAIAAAAITTTAQADSVGTVDLEYTGHIGNSADLRFNNGSDSGDYNNVRIGLYTFDVANPTGSGDLVPAYGFCIDLAQDAPSDDGNWRTDDHETYDISYLSDAPSPAMGADKAAYISQLWARNFDADWYTDNPTDQIEKEASAFSLAIWEIVNEDYQTDVSKYDVTEYNSDYGWYKSGWHWKEGYKHGFDASDDWSDEQLANQWLHELTADGPTANLVALTSDCNQDFVMQLPPPVIPVTSVPLPAAFPAGMAVLGILGLGGYIRRRRRIAAA